MKTLHLPWDKTVLAIMLLLLLVGCLAPGVATEQPSVPRIEPEVQTQHKALQMQQQLWQEQGIANYSYVLQLRCFCDEQLQQAVIVKVRDATSYVSKQQGGYKIVDARFDSFTTIDKLLTLIEEALTLSPNRKITVEYDPKLGYPVKISRSAAFSDDGLWIEVRDFEIEQ